MANQSNPTSPVTGQPLLHALRRQQTAWLLLGLFIGLLVGWVIWPVGWSDAGMDDLPPNVRAHYISATADAYVAAGGQDPATALARMQVFSNPQTAVFDAIAFYQASNDSNRLIREVNLRSLASALGAYAPAPSLPADSQEIGWVDWTLGVLAALLLLGGGIWIGYRAWTQQTHNSQPAANTPGFATQPQPLPSQPLPSQTANTGGWQPTAPPDARPNDPAAAPRVTMETWDSETDAPPFATRIQPPPPVRPRPFPAEEPPIERIAPLPVGQTLSPDDEDELDEDEFEDEEGDDFDEADFDLGDPKANERQRRQLSAWLRGEDDEDAGVSAPGQAATELQQGEWVNDEDEPNDDRFDGTLVADWDPDDDLDDTVDEEFEFDEEEGDDLEVTAGEVLSRPTPESQEQEKIEPATFSAPRYVAAEDETETGGFLPAVRGVFGALRREDKEANRGGREVGAFRAEFHIGMQAYEQSFIITSTGDDEGAPLGACGVGISERLDKEAAHSEKVRVLDVWLYDGVEVRSYNQYLITPGMDKEGVAGQAPSAGTITGEPLEIAPGLSFRIQSKNLLLDCRLPTAELLNPGAPLSPLRSVRIEMTARAAK